MAGPWRMPDWSAVELAKSRKRQKTSSSDADSRPCPVATGIGPAVAQSDRKLRFSIRLCVEAGLRHWPTRKGNEISGKIGHAGQDLTAGPY